MQHTLRRLLVGAVTTAAVTTGAAALAPEAQAATAVSACFQYPDGRQFANMYVELLRFNPATKRYESSGRSGSTNANGCATFFNTRPTDYFRMKAEGLVRSGPMGTYYRGEAPGTASPGYVGVHLGTGVVHAI